MEITGIIAEYNPFHYGHKYQIKEAKKSSDAIAVIMSGSFVQRGHIAITDKWSRARAALENGADIVFELPVVYSLNTAQKFAQGAVELFDRMGAISKLCFGSECGDINKLKEAAYLLENEPQEVSKKTKKMMDDGMLYPAAREKAFDGFIDNEILSSPNNILAVEYIRALISLKSRIEPFTIKRKGAQYHDTAPNTENASAAAIRKMLAENKDIAEFTPKSDFKVYDANKLDTAVIALLRSIDPEQIAKISEVGEGLENRIKLFANESQTIDELCEKVKSKRYPMSRIRRIVFNTLLGISKEIAESKVNYIRVLGMTQNGAKALKEIKNKTDLTIITKTADYKTADIVFKKDILSTDIFELCAGGNGGRDYRESPVII